MVGVRRIQRIPVPFIKLRWHRVPQARSSKLKPLSLMGAAHCTCASFNKMQSHRSREASCASKDGTSAR